MNKTRGTLIIMAIAATAALGSFLGSSNIDPDHKFSWSENKGWMNWLDASGGADGVEVLSDHLAGYIWRENDGWLNVGNGGGPYANNMADSSTFGVNILPGGDLDGFGWHENSGWVNFGWAASTANPDRARFDSGAGRFRGYAWNESKGWINLDDATHYVAASVSTCTHCQLHADVFPFTEGAANDNPVGNCVVDLDDILTILAAFSAENQCDPDFPDTVNMFPCDQACPEGVVDLDDILSTLAAFSGTYRCAHPCPGGACCVPCSCDGDVNDDGSDADLDDVFCVVGCVGGGDCTCCTPNQCDVNCDGLLDQQDIDAIQCLLSGMSPAVCCDSNCEDWDGVGSGTTPPGGMSQAQCDDKGGTYQGDNTTCDDVSFP